MTGIQTYKKALGKLILRTLLLLMLPVSIFSQEDLPDTPKMTRVTWVHETDAVLVEWEASKDPTVDMYWVKKQEPDGSWTRIYGLDSKTLFYNITNDDLKGQTYIVTALDTIDDRESLHGTNEHRAIEVSVEFDPCAPANIITWTDYVGWEGKLSGYRILGGIAGDEMEELGFVINPNIQTFPHEGVSYDTRYTYYVEAISISTDTTRSPIEEVRTSFPDIPELLRIDEVSVIDDNTLEMSFTADVDGPINNFRILRRSGTDNSFREIETIWDSQMSNMHFIDHVSTSDGRYEYLIESLYKPESCLDEITVDSSNMGTSVWLDAQFENQIVQLTWTPYESYETGLSGYLVERKSGEGEFVDVASLGAGSTSWREAIESVIHASQPGEIQYRVKALSNQVEGADPGISISNIASVSMETTMEVPTAFTPGRTSNAIFKPVFDFVPSKYQMIIYDRSGRKLFETNDPSQGWDGTFNGGSFAMEGVYVVFIQYTDYTGRSMTYPGNVSVLYPPQY